MELDSGDIATAHGCHKPAGVIADSDHVGRIRAAHMEAVNEIEVELPALKTSEERLAWCEAQRIPPDVRNLVAHWKVETFDGGIQPTQARVNAMLFARL